MSGVDVVVRMIMNVIMFLVFVFFIGFCLTMSQVEKTEAEKDPIVEQAGKGLSSVSAVLLFAMFAYVLSIIASLLGNKHRK